jgi:hypothetical protein
MMRTALIFSFLFTMGGLMAQPGRAEERIEAHRIAFITQRLQLTPDEARAFWPVYNQHQDQLKKLRESRRPGKSIESLTEQEAEAALSKFLEFQDKEAALMRETTQKLRKVLPTRKILALYHAEHEFKQKLLQEIQERRGQQGGRGQ